MSSHVSIHPRIVVIVLLQLAKYYLSFSAVLDPTRHTLVGGSLERPRDVHASNWLTSLAFPRQSPRPQCRLSLVHQTCHRTSLH